MTKEEMKEQLRLDRNAIRTVASRGVKFLEFKAECKRLRVNVIQGLREGINMWMKQYGYEINVNLYPDFRAATVKQEADRGERLTEHEALDECMTLWLKKYVK